MFPHLWDGIAWYSNMNVQIIMEMVCKSFNIQNIYSGGFGRKPNKLKLHFLNWGTSKKLKSPALLIFNKINISVFFLLFCKKAVQGVKLQTRSGESGEVLKACAHYMWNTKITNIQYLINHRISTVYKKNPFIFFP